MNRFLISIIAVIPLFAVASNTTNQSFNQAKKQLLSVYQDHRETLYCGAAFDAKGQVISPPGFTTKTHLARAKKSSGNTLYLPKILAKHLLSGVMAILNVSIAKVSRSRAASVPRR